MNQQIDKEFSELFGKEEHKIAAAQPLKFKRTKNPQTIPEQIPIQQTGITEQTKPAMQPIQPMQQMQQHHQQQQAFHMQMKKDKCNLKINFNKIIIEAINPEQQELISKKPFNVKNIRQGSAKNDRLQELEKLKQQQGNLYQKLGLVQEKPQQFAQEKTSEQQQNTPNSIAYTKPNLKPSKEAIQAAIQKNQNLKGRKEMKYEQGKITEEERLQLIKRKKQKQQQLQQEQWLQQQQQQQMRKKNAVEQIQVEDDEDYSNDIQFEDESEEELVRPSTAVQKFQFKPKQDGEKKQFLPAKEDPNKNLEEQNRRRKKEKELAFQRAKLPVAKGMNRNELRDINQDIPIPQFEDKEQDYEEKLLMAPMQKKKKGMMLGGQKLDEREIVFTNQEECTNNTNNIGSEEVSEKVQQQRKRCKDLRNMVFLEEEQFDDILVVNPTGQYEQYVNRIKKAVVKNFAAQCNDDNVDREIQTDDIETNDFVNQCPEDRIVTLAQSDQQQQQGQSNFNGNKIIETPQLTEFVFRISPIIEELLDQMWIGQQRQTKNQRDNEPHITQLQLTHPEIEQELTPRYIYSMDGDHHNTVYLVFGSSRIIEIQNGKITRGFKSKRENDPISSLHRAKYLLFSGSDSGGIEIYDLRSSSTSSGSFFNSPVWDNCIVSTFQELSSAQDTSRVVSMKSQIQNNGIQLIVLQQFSRIEV